MSVVTLPNTGAGDITPRVATELIGSDHFQYIKLVDGRSGSTTPIGTSGNPLNIQQIGVASIIGSVGMTQLAGPWTFIGSVFASPLSATVIGSVNAFVAAGSINAVAVGSVAATILGGNVAHDAADAGNPVKIGGFAVTSSFPSYVDSGDRVNAIFDRGGRLLVQQHAPVTMRQNRWGTFTGPLSGTIVASCLTPGGRIIVTDYNIQAGSATAGIVGLYFARSGNPVNITVGSGTALFYGELAPSATAKPGAVKVYTYPEVSDPNDALRISITTSMQIYISVGYYEAA